MGCDLSGPIADGSPKQATILQCLTVRPGLMDERGAFNRSDPRKENSGPSHVAERRLNSC
jgi:hypothetical protein